MIFLVTSPHPSLSRPGAPRQPSPVAGNLEFLSNLTYLSTNNKPQQLQQQQEVNPTRFDTSLEPQTRQFTQVEVPSAMNNPLAIQLIISSIYDITLRANNSPL